MKIKYITLPLIIILLTVFHGTALPQDEDLFPGGRYNSEIPTPLEILGHRFGQIHTFHWEMEKYIHEIDRVSDRVKVFNYGRSYQGRDLYYILIGSEENINRYDEIRKDNLRLTDPRITSPEEAERLSDSMPAIVWLGYNIHGNEASSMEAAIRILYQLAAGTDETTMNLLDNVLCIIDPDQNPDGHDRFVQGVRSVVTLKSHPQTSDAEHSSAWPGGRGNHYFFDLNRDFFLKTQVESLMKTRIFHEWRPHVFVDHHEMGTNSTFYSFPPMDPYSEYMSPLHFKWWDIIADGVAESFDNYGWDYFTGESFDTFYPGYGESYPSMNGSIGILYEQASPRGSSINRTDGSVLTLREASWHHFTASMATLLTTASRKKEKIRDFYQYFVDAMNSAKDEPIKEIILVPGNDPHMAADLIENMLAENIEIRIASQPFTNKNSTSYISKETGSNTFPAGSYIISLDQPQKVVIKTLLAPESPLQESFIEDEIRRKEEGERSHFYDVTAWSMPLANNIETYWTSKTSDFEGDLLDSPPEFSGKVIGGIAKQAYLIPFNTFTSSKLMNELLKEDYRVRIARKSFTIGENTWQKGTLVIRVNRNKDTLHEKVTEISQKYGIDIYALNTGLASDGIDLGSNNIAPVIKPEIAIVTDEPASSSSYGAIHYLSEREMDLDFTRITVDNFDDLDDYNVLVLPSGSYGRAVNEDRLESLKQWIRKGGTVVAVQRAVDWLRSSKISEIELLNNTPDPEDRDKTIKPDYTPGAILKINMNPLSFLSYGLTESLPVFVRSSNIYKTFADDKFKNIGTFAEDSSLRLSGWIWQDTEKYFYGNGYLFLERSGRGKIISFVEDPNFRAAYNGLNKLFFNAILLGPSFN